MSADSNLLSIVPFNHLDDSLFNLVLYEVSYGPVIYDGDIPESLKFDPIDQPELGNMLSSYLDPDSYVESRLPCSNYVVEEELSNQTRIANNSDSFAIMHIDSRSLLLN